MSRGHNFSLKKDIVNCVKYKLYIYRLFNSKAQAHHTGEYTCKGSKRNGIEFKEKTIVQIGGKFLFVV